jgi:predicted enzyme related to lactoylglutathione lyase
MSDHGTIHWSELHTNDVEGTKAFFAATAGWTYEGMPMPNTTYWVANANGVSVAGIMDAAAVPDGPREAHWMTYIAVDDIDKVAAETAANGGTIVSPPFDVPGVGRIAMIMDPGGAVVGMMTPAPQE